MYEGGHDAEAVRDTELRKVLEEYVPLTTSGAATAQTHQIILLCFFAQKCLY